MELFWFFVPDWDKINSGFCRSCPKQCICLCTVLVEIMNDKILWILYKHLSMCICGLNSLQTVSLLFFIFKKLVACKYACNSFKLLLRLLKEYHFILRWAIQELHKRMNLKGKKNPGLWIWTFIVKRKNNSERGAFSKTKLHVIPSLFHISKNLLTFVLTFLKPKSLPFSSLLFRMHSGTLYSFCFPIVKK